MQLLQQLCVGDQVSVYQLITSPCNGVMRHCLVYIGRLMQKEKCDLYPREAEWDRGDRMTLELWRVHGCEAETTWFQSRCSLSVAVCP